MKIIDGSLETHLANTQKPFKKNGEECGGGCGWAPAQPQPATAS